MTLFKILQTACSSSLNFSQFNDSSASCERVMAELKPCSLLPQREAPAILVAMSLSVSLLYSILFYTSEEKSPSQL